MTERWNEPRSVTARDGKYVVDIRDHGIVLALQMPMYPDHFDYLTPEEARELARLLNLAADCTVE